MTFTKWTEEDVRDAIYGLGRWANPDGTPNPIKPTRKAITSRLQIHYMTWYNYLKRWPELHKAMADVQAMRTDRAEEALDDLIDEGFWPAVQMELQTRGASRGYAKRTLVSADVYNSDNPLTEMTDEALDALLRGDGGDEDDDGEG